MKISRILLLCIGGITFLEGNYVSYEFSGGRFGDNLLAYSHALWISYKHNVPLLYRPFKYASKLKLSESHYTYDALAKHDVDKIVTFSDLRGKQNFLDLSKSRNALYLIPYFPHCEFDIGERFHFDINWEDREFQALLRSKIQPLQKAIPLPLPENRHLVAVHVRTGAGHDKIFQMREVEEQINGESQHQTIASIEKSSSPSSKSMPLIAQRGIQMSLKSKFADKLHPLKFPSDSFYVTQITKLSEILNDEPMYVHVFTDSSHPEKMAALYEKMVNKPNIIFGFRQQNNNHDSNVVEDFFALLQFDYLIRGESNFSIVAGFLKDYRITIFPKTFSWKCNSLEILDAEIRYHRDMETILKASAGKPIFGLLALLNLLDLIK